MWPSYCGCLLVVQLHMQWLLSRWIESGIVSINVPIKSIVSSSFIVGDEELVDLPSVQSGHVCGIYVSTCHPTIFVVDCLVYILGGGPWQRYVSKNGLKEDICHIEIEPCA